MVWRAFLEIGSARGGGFGPEPITWAGIEAWSRVTGTRLEPWEARLIRSLDDGYLDLLDKRERARKAEADDAAKRKARARDP
jgi:hypothetical protein